MLFSRNKIVPDASLLEDDRDYDLLALIDGARTEEEVRRVARFYKQRSRARIQAARVGAR